MPILGANQLQPLIHRINLLFHIPNNRCPDDIALTVHDVGGGIAEDLGDKVLVELAFRVRGDVHIGNALLLQNVLGSLQLLLSLAGVGACADEIDILLLKLVIQLLQLRHLLNAGATAVVPEVDDGGVVVCEDVAAHRGPQCPPR